MQNKQIRKRTFFLILMMLALTSFSLFSQQTSVTIGYVTIDHTTENAEHEAALEFLEECEKYEVTPIEISSIGDVDLQKFDALWIHTSDSTMNPSELLSEDGVKNVVEYLEDGGGLLLTLEGMRFLSDLGIESNPPNVHHLEIEKSEIGRYGVHAFRSHPLFEGLHGGAALYKPYINTTLRLLGYFEDTVPEEGNVFAVGHAYIFLYEQMKLGVEHHVGKGKVVSMGGLMYFADELAEREKLSIVMNNAFEYLASDEQLDEVKFWNYKERVASEFSLDEGETKIGEPKAWDNHMDSPTLTKRFGEEEFFDVTSPRMMVMGDEKSGITELWVHPFMALRKYEVALEYRDQIFKLSDYTPRVEVKPEGFVRTYKFRRAYLKEVITVDPNKPVAVVHYEFRGLFAAKMHIVYNTNFRFMWPYSHTVLGSMEYTFSEGLNATAIKNHSGDFGLVTGSNKEIIEKSCEANVQYDFNDSSCITVPTEHFSIGVKHTFAFDQSGNLDFVIAASDESIEKTVEYYKEAIADPEKVYNDNTEYNRAIANEKLSIKSPDGVFNEGYFWSVIGTDRFYVTTPGIGSSLVAGYGTTERGWDGTHEVSGRPGYAWYFGRDAVWSAFAMLDYGDYEKVKEVLKFLQKYQDVSGKILHELATSGIVHYDASDATPLYVILAGYYLRYSGDEEFIKESWDKIEKAMEFCYSTDTDDDGLIENTGVGHGWVEGGHLYGSHTSTHLAMCWSKALEEAVMMGKVIGEDEFIEQWSDDAKDVREQLNTKFWCADSSFYHFGLMEDGSMMSDVSMMAAVPVYFEQTKDEYGKLVVKRINEYDFTTDWGMRILSEHHEKFHPRGYHYGSVWPLFTGWTALAQYDEGWFSPGFTNIMHNLNNYSIWSLGFIEEVLDGSSYRKRGVCSHQCWSGTMIPMPAIEGMLGLKPNAPEKKLTFAPALPADWEFLTLENMRVGDSFITAEMKKEEGIITYEFIPQTGESATLVFKPYLPAGTEITEVLLDGTPVEFETNKTEKFTQLMLDIPVTKKSKLEIKHSGGIEVLPIVHHPKPNYKSVDMKIVDYGLQEGGTYSVITQGTRLGNSTMEIYHEGYEIASVTNGKVLSTANNISKVQVSFDDAEGSKYLTKEVVLTIESK